MEGNGFGNKKVQMTVKTEQRFYANFQPPQKETKICVKNAETQKELFSPFLESESWGAMKRGRGMCGTFKAFNLMY